jgi:glycosyltransferase involved in cell wall biosynthesis
VCPGFAGDFVHAAKPRDRTVWAAPAFQVEFIKTRFRSRANSMLTPAPAENPHPARPTVSVVLPNYNHARLIMRAVAALQAQKRPPDEIFIIEDASTDQSLHIIEELAAGWNNIRVLVNKENQGTIAALSRGLDLCGGKYIYFAAADDWIEPDFFSSGIDMLERHPQAGLFCGEADLVDGRTGRRLGIRPAVRPANRPEFFDASAVANLLRSSDNWILTGSAVFRRDRVMEAGGFSSELGSFADGYLVRKIALRHGFCYAPEIVATWCIFEESFSRTTAANAAEATRVMVQAVAHIAADPVFPSWYPALFDRRLRFATSRLAVLARPINRPVLLQLSVQSRIGRAVLGAICRLPLGPVVRPLLLGWLWLRFRPVSLMGLSKTVCARYWERRGTGGREPASPPLDRSKPGNPSHE